MMFDNQTKWKTSDVRSKNLDRLITEMIATDNQPFNFVENNGFQRLMATAEPRYALKSEKFYRTEVFPSIHNSIAEKVKALLKLSLFYHVIEGLRPSKGVRLTHLICGLLCISLRLL